MQPHVSPAPCCVLHTDFGLAVFYDPAKLPRTDLGLEGTPWYMAPEVRHRQAGRLLKYSVTHRFAFIALPCLSTHMTSTWQLPSCRHALTTAGMCGVSTWSGCVQVLSSCVEPASDVWAAGVMAYQLLSGRFPFDDWAHPEAPALSLVSGRGTQGQCSQGYPCLLSVLCRWETQQPTG
jgi:calcium-dependent protein kinase